MNDLLIQSSQGSYPVRFFPDLDQLAREIAAVPNPLLIIDRKVARACPDFAAALSHAMPVHEVDASEGEKTLEGCARVLTFMQANNATRQSRLLALGGGIVQDIATLCAHLYYRGISWHYYPTTLLGMADSCIGAKASINFNHYKNQLGVFHSPAGVGICPRFLDSLPEVELRSGWGEIVKLHLAGSREDFTSAADALRTGGWRTSRLPELIHSSLRIKKAVIEVDEFDNGIRRTLNYGHTFGHALEAVTHHAIPHGLAVAWGMDLINHLALRRGLLSESDYAGIHALLREFFAWRLPAPVTADQLIDTTRRDKKVRDGRLNLAILRRPGELVIKPQAYDEALNADLTDYLSGPTIATW